MKLKRKKVKFSDLEKSNNPVQVPEPPQDPRPGLRARMFPKYPKPAEELPSLEDVQPKVAEPEPEPEPVLIPEQVEEVEDVSPEEAAQQVLEVATQARDPEVWVAEFEGAFRVMYNRQVKK